MFTNFNKIRNGLLVIVIATLAACAQNPNNVQYVYVGDNFRALDELNAPPNGINFSVNAPSSGKLGQQVGFQITPEANGYLWILQVDSDDRVDLIFPNYQDGENYLRAGSSANIPGQSGYEFYLGRPLGNHLLAFVMTTARDDIAAVLPPRILAALQRSQQLIVDKGIRLQRYQDWGLVKRTLTVQQ